MIITLCGSARFEKQFHLINKALSLIGHTVFSLAVFPSIEGKKHWYTEDEKLTLDRVHKNKIKNSQAIVVINRFGYVGESTLSEIDHAEALDKKIYYLESWKKGVVTNTKKSNRYVSENYKTVIDTCAHPPYIFHFMDLIDEYINTHPQDPSIHTLDDIISSIVEPQ